MEPTAVVPETPFKPPSRTPRRKSISLGLKNLLPLPPSPPNQFNVKITGQLEYIKNPVYFKAIRDKQEPPRPLGESSTYTVEVGRDVHNAIPQAGLAIQLAIL